MSFPPDAFIIGAQRAGTTSLSGLLDQHPDIVLSNPKEPDFFSVNWEQGLDWYRSRFRRDAAILLDASVSYTMTRPDQTSGQVPDYVPRRIHEVSPHAKFIYLVRDPAERCYSAYWHEVRAGRERRSLREAVKGSAYYVMASYYHLQLDPFLRCFPQDRFLIVPFEDFAQRPLRVASTCATFLGADDSFAFRPEQPRNQAFVYSKFGKALRDTMGEERLKALSSIVSNTLPDGMRRLAKRLVSNSIPELSTGDRDWLRRQFADDAQAFANLTGVQVAA